MLTGLIPEPPAVDRSKAGVLTVNPQFLGGLLRLPAGQEVVGAEIDAVGNLLLTVEGEGLPDRPTQGPLPHVVIICTTCSRPGDVAGGGCQLQVTAAWAHAPDASWVLKPWEATR